MTPTRRTLLAAAGLATLDHGATAGGPGRDSLSAETTQLLREAEEANDALMRGDVDRYLELVAISEDFTLMSPFGGKPSHARNYTPATWEGMKTFFRDGKLKMELVQAYATEEIVVLAVLERARVEVGGLPAQDWTLRVTLVYRREDRTWKLVHRHADPLGAAPITVAQSAALARGDR
jgi:ketosteroid isomerase-like protein